MRPIPFTKVFLMFRPLGPVSPRRQKQRRSYRPEFDLLEDRCVPTTFTVMNNGDLAGDPGSLRGILTLTNSTISGCPGTANVDGALYDNSSGALPIPNCTFTGNTTTTNVADGSAIWFKNCAATITNCTISGNSNTMMSGAGIFL